MSSISLSKSLSSLLAPIFYLGSRMC